jgi:hypothetical protein
LSNIRYPYIPAVNFTLAGITTQKYHLDRGPLFNIEAISGDRFGDVRCAQQGAYRDLSANFRPRPSA